MTHRSSLEWTPPCHGGDRRFESGMGRCRRRQAADARRQASVGKLGPPVWRLMPEYGAVRQRLERPVLGTGVCEFESHPRYLSDRC